MVTEHDKDAPLLPSAATEANSAGIPMGNNTNIGTNDSVPQKSSLLRNVSANWLGHFVFIVGGFILPRLISDHLGQERLGIWDFGWATVSYLNLLTVGIASSVNRYVAKFRSSAQWDEMSACVSCCACIFTCSAITGVFITIALMFFLPTIAPSSFAPYMEETRALLFCLGLSVSVDLFIPTFTGVISGSQRYDILALIESGCYLLLLVWIVLILIMGGSLYFLGLPILVMRLAEALIKRLLASRLCPLLKVSYSLVTWQGLKTVFAFGGKTFMEASARMGLYQGNNILVAYFFGPAALAVYARSMALIFHANKLLFHFGRVFAPSASHCKANGDIESLRVLVLQGARSGALIALPLALVLGVLGDSLLHIWMGPGYADIPLLPILAFGHFFAHAQIGTYYSLMGMNQHGRASLATFICAVISIVATVIMVKYFQLGLVGVSMSVGLAVALPYLMVVPGLVAKSLGLSMRNYLAEIMGRPVLVSIPFALCLWGARRWAGPNDYAVLGFGLGLGGLSLILVYWCWVLPEGMKHKFLKLLL